MKRNLFISIVSAVVAVPAVIIAVAACQGGRPEGPCDVYAKGGSPCASAHSTTRALFKDYNGPLYQVMRASDGKKLDIGIVNPYGYADSEAQDAFCADTYCWITVIYDQGPSGNDLEQAPRGGFSGHAMGGFNNVPMADWAPVTLNGHKVYGTYIVPGSGMRQNDTKDIAVDDQAEGQYWVIAGNHFNDGCCFDYGNAEIDSRDDGDGTMETTYFGNATSWYYGEEPGPWIMTDQENNLVGCVNDDPNDKFCPTINAASEWRFITATADGEPHHWRSMGGNAQGGELRMYYDGRRIVNPRSSYDPMRKQGAILLGNGGDNSNGSQGTFYEGAVTVAGTFPTEETNQAVQANIVAAKYDVERLVIASEDAINAPNRSQTFYPGQTQSVAVKFVNTTGKALKNLVLSVVAPKGWKTDAEKAIDYTVEPGQTVIVTFNVTSGNDEFNGDLTAVAKWGKNTFTAIEKVRNTAPVKINEYRSANASATDSFIELYNASDKEVDISGWTVTHHKINLPFFSSIKVPSGTKLGAKGFYVMGLATSGLSVPAAKGDKVIYVRSIEGIKAGDTIQIGSENAVVAKVIDNSPKNVVSTDFRNVFVPGTPTTLWQPLPDGPVITIPAGANNIPVTSVTGFQPGMKMAIGYGAEYPATSRVTEKYEVVTVTSVGKPGTQAWLSYDAKPGETNIKVSSVANITAGDKLRLDIASKEHGIEWVTVKSVGTASTGNPFNGPMSLDQAGTGLELEEPLKFAHSANLPFANNGTGITFEPATKFAHSSNEPVLALVYAIELKEGLGADHDIDEAVVDAKVTTAGFQGKPDQFYGGPEFGNAGNITLRTAAGNIADAVNYGYVVDPWLSEGFHGESGHGVGGSYAPIYRVNTRNMAPGMVIKTPNLSAGRFPDGADLDDNKKDFNIQSSAVVAASVRPGDNNIKVINASQFKVGSKIIIGDEEFSIKEAGSTGASVLSQSIKPGEATIYVAAGQGFGPGQPILIGDELVLAANVSQGRRQPGSNTMAPTKIVVSGEIKKAHPAGTSVTGTGITLSGNVKGSYGPGTPLTGNIPTPGAPNVY